MPQQKSCADALQQVRENCTDGVDYEACRLRYGVHTDPGHGRCECIVTTESRSFYVATTGKEPQRVNGWVMWGNPTRVLMEP